MTGEELNYIQSQAGRSGLTVQEYLRRLVYDKPIIYADFVFDTSPYDAWWLEKDFWTVNTFPRLGQKLDADNLDRIKEQIDTCIEDPRFAESRREVRDEIWSYYGEGTKRTVDWICGKYKELTD